MPFYRVELHTRLPVAEAVRRVASCTQRKPRLMEPFWSAFGTDDKKARYFAGEVTADAFSICRVIRYQNGFAPQIRGKVLPELGGSRIRLTMHLHPLAGLFMAFWLSMVGFMSVQMLAAPTGAGTGTLIPIGMFVFGVALTALAFYPEAIKAKNKLMSVLDAKTAPAGRVPTVSR
ncbi:hypothetical protein FCE95_12560 [Luteimonas gilva]|uniref:Uncharacterized protein n=1 Tax=Luteimonas gilva TaxID=2572684 RepID=A0A4U5JR11_9GAMM|nr:hypothetical protein [Luteimonas gilva]TKR30918.1 hypothetical protein FCE95_12560 [Luteimonas gilva]